MSKRNATSSRSTTNTTKNSSRVVFKPSEHDGSYERTHSTSNVSMRIRREDTRHGGTSEVSITRGGSNVNLTLSEARSLKAFLDRELAVRAR